MVMTTARQDLENFFNSELYKTLLSDACNICGLSLNSEFPEILYKYDENKLECSKLKLSDLSNTILNCSQELRIFIKLKFYEDPKNTIGNFSANELPGENDKPKLVQKMPAYKNFLLGYLIEFAIIKNNPDTIVQYLKCVRIPSASSYAKSLKKWYIQAKTV